VHAADPHARVRGTGLHHPVQEGQQVTHLFEDAEIYHVLIIVQQLVKQSGGHQLHVLVAHAVVEVDVRCIRSNYLKNLLPNLGMGDFRKNLATPSEKDFGSNGANISGTEQ